MSTEAQAMAQQAHLDDPKSSVDVFELPCGYLTPDKELWRHVKLREIDGECEDNFLDNIRINGFEGRIEYRVGSSEMLKPNERFDLILCNILFQNAEPHLTKIARQLADKGCLILSGYLTEESGAVRRRIQGTGLQVASHSEQEEWGALVAQRQ